MRAELDEVGLFGARHIVINLFGVEFTLFCKLECFVEVTDFHASLICARKKILHWEWRLL